MGLFRLVDENVCEPGNEGCRSLLLWNMTIRNDWCSTCDDDAGSDQFPASICSKCGQCLVARPQTTARTERRSRSSTGSFAPRLTVLPEHILQQVQTANQELHLLFAELRQQVSSIRTQTLVEQQQTIAPARTVMEDFLQELSMPPEPLNPQQARWTNRGTAKKVLDELPRIYVDDKSTFLVPATLSISNGGPTFNVILGQFGSALPLACNGNRKSLVLASPCDQTTKLSPETTSNANDSIVYMECEDDTTLVEMASMAQHAGAVAVVIPNQTNSTWPFVMKDNFWETISLAVRIQVVMINVMDGQCLVKHCQADPTPTCNLALQSVVKECIICCEMLDRKLRVVQLPACGHIFHESCALTWLTVNNSCPYCRRLLPTDDVVYEAEQRMIGRTYAGNPERTSREQAWIT